jgi:glycosyltransferase involved in cell wall biosynthesis
MKLLLVGHAFLLAYAQQKFVAMKRLDPRLELRIVVPEVMRDRFRTEKYEVHPALGEQEVIPLPACFTRLQQHMTYMHNPMALGSVLRKFKPDVIHVDEEPQALVSAETIALQKAVARNAAVTLFTWDNLLRPRRFPMGTGKSLLRKYSLARTTTMICGNRRAAELIRQEGHFHGAIETLPQSGLNPEEHEPGSEGAFRAELGLDNAVVIGHVGRLVPEKGILLLLNSLTHLENFPWKLMLVGGGSLESEIRNTWMARFPNRIVWVPPVRYEQVTKYLRCIDIFVLASYTTPTWAEQFGLSLAQAMLLGLPCVGSTSGAIPDVLGGAGLLFEEGQAAGLTEALRTLLSSSAVRTEYGKRARDFALNHYTLERVAEGYLAAFERARQAVITRKQIGLPIADSRA